MHALENVQKTKKKLVTTVFCNFSREFELLHPQKVTIEDLIENWLADAARNCGSTRILRLHDWNNQSLR